MSKNSLFLAKPLSGLTLNIDSASIGKLTTNNLDIPPDVISSLLNGTIISNVTIINSKIDNTIVGVDGSNQGIFTTLTTSSDVIFYSNDKTKDVTWDSFNGILSVNGNMAVEGCMTISNISICQNTIRAINNNGDLNLITPGTGTIYLTGPITNIVNSQGNFVSSLNNGNVVFSSSDFQLFQSNNSYYTVSSFKDQTFTTINGDISLNTEQISSISIKKLFNTVGNIQITTNTLSRLRTGDIITISDSPSSDGVYKVTNIIDQSNFNISVGNSFIIFQNATVGNLIKTISNNINLNASLYINVPNNIPIAFANTSNTIYGNTGGMYISSLNNITFKAPNNDVSAGNYKIEIPQSTHFQLGTSGSNYINYGVISNNLYDSNTNSSSLIYNTDNGISLNLNSNNNITINTSNNGYLNISHLYILDQNPLIANYLQVSSDLTDRGIQFNYWNANTSTSNLGWFGYKQNTGNFTFLKNTTNNNNIFTGTLGDFNVGNINSNNLTISTGGSINLQCGQLINVNLITGCGGTVNMYGSNNVNITAGTRISLISNGDIYIPNNIQLTLGSSGSSIKENTSSNLLLTSFENIILNTSTNGSIVIPISTKLSFNGTTQGNTSIYSSNGNLNINNNNNIFITTTVGNIVLSANNLTSNTTSSIQFGNSTEILNGSTNGIYLISNSSFGNINLIANSNVNISNSIGNILLKPLNGDIQLYTTQGNVRLYQSSSLIFDISGTANSLNANSIGNLIINGPNNTILGSIGNSISIKNASVINLEASVIVNIPNKTQLNIDGTQGNRFIITDTNGNFNITNNLTSGNLNINSLNTTIFNTNGTTSIINNNTNISSNTFTITGTDSYINTNNLYIKEQNPLIANYLQNSLDNTDRGIQYNYWNANTSTSNLGWFGVKSNSQQFTFFQNAINTADVITGTLGTFNLGSINVSNNISFLTTGNINMACGTISNLNTILGCNGTINISSTNNLNISSTNIMLISNTNGTINIPYNVPLSFGNTVNNILTTSNGTCIITVNNGNGTLILNSNVQINGTTNNVYSTITNYQDPIISIGGITGSISNDLKDRGIEFKWSDGITAQTGFFGFQNSTQRFVFYAKDTNNNEIINGTLGNVQFANGHYNNLDVNCGTIANVSLLSACNGTGLTLLSSNTYGINLSTSNTSLPFNSFLNFGNTSNSISVSSSGNMILTSQFNTNIISQSGGILLNSNQFINIPQDVPLYFGNTSSNSFIERNSSGELIITNSTGNIQLNPYTNGNNGGGFITIPTNDTLIFGNPSTNITSDGDTLFLNGNNISINSAGYIQLNGDVNIVGNIINTIPTSEYILPLGTTQIDTISNIYNSTQSNTLNITTQDINYLSIGDIVNITNTNSDPAVIGAYNVSGILTSTTFTISSGTVLITSGNIGSISTDLKTYQGKDVGIEFDYWDNPTNNGITSGSAYFETGFLVRQSTTGNLAYYSHGLLSSNVITSGTLGNLQLNKLITNQISGFSLQGTLQAQTFIVAGSNFQISGGAIDNTVIGQTTAQTGRFTNLTSTVSTNIQNTTLQGTLGYSLERYTLSSLIQTGSPSVSTIISYVSISGLSLITSGTMGSSGVTDGQVKKVIMSSIGLGCKYILQFQPGKLITPNPLGGNPQTITFKRQGQSCEILWDNTLLAWVLQGGSGGYVS